MAQPACSRRPGRAAQRRWRLGAHRWVAGLALASAAGAQAHPVESLAPVQVVDSLGRRVERVAPARRVISLAPHATELIAAAGGQDTLVGVIRDSDYPPVVRLVPQVGDAWQIDRERVIALQPDLIVAWLEPAVAALQPMLQTLGIPVFFSAPTRLAQVPEQIEALGELLGTLSPARRAATAWRQRLDTLRRDQAGQPVRTVFIEVGRAPLYTLNQQHIVNDIVTTCGAHNVFAQAPVVAPPVSVEAVVNARPDLIVVAAKPTPANQRAADEYWQRYATALPAAARPVLIDPDLLVRPGPRLLEGAAQLCQAVRSLAP